MKKEFTRPLLRKLLERLKQPRRFIQVLVGPRQTGKTTLAFQVLERWKQAAHYASADEPTLKDLSWVEEQWEIARTKTSGRTGALLILDEIQKIPGWSECVKRLWDEDTRRKLRMHVILLGSSALLVQSGLADSLAGRFEIINVTHWSFPEMRAAFGWNVKQYLFFGGF